MPSLGNPPYSFQWNTTPPQNTQTATGLCGGTYKVTVSDENVSIIDSVTINPLPPPDTVPICLVTVDSLSKNNIILWDKTPYANIIDSFFIYREIATNNYQIIGKVPYDSLSLFVDTMRTAYFPNSGNPNAGSYRYKIKVVDSCGNISAFSPYHNTIFITSNNGNFFWAQTYSVENSSNPVSAYVLMRDDYANGNWHAVNSVSGYQQSITDPDYAAWQATARWRVETQWNISCTPTFKSTAPYTSSFSNIYGNAIVSLGENSNQNEIRVFPVLSKGQYNFYFPQSSSSEIKQVKIYSIHGTLIFSNSCQGTSAGIDIRNVNSGLYFYCISYGNMNKNGMLIKE